MARMRFNRGRSLKIRTFVVTAAIAVLAILAGCGVPLLEAPLRAILDAEVERARAQPPDPGDPTYAPQSFVNWESPHVSPLDLTPDGTRLLVVNTAAARLEVFDVTGAAPRWVGAAPVGLDPVSVRVRSADEAWVVNRISDSVSIVDLRTLRVTRTHTVSDEPADVAFAGGRAFVVCSQSRQVHIFDAARLDRAPLIRRIAGMQPRAATVSPDGKRVYVAIFESGNATTALRDDVVSQPDGPYGGQNPIPIDAGIGSDLTPEQLNTARGNSVILRRDPQTRAWLDANGTDWSAQVTWDVLDHDVAVIDVESLEVSYVGGLMNLAMQLALRPDGRLTVVGTQALNHVRFEPNLRGKFVRHVFATIDAEGAGRVRDLNPHLTEHYSGDITPLSTEQRAASVADPRAIVWASDGRTGYVAGMGSNNVARIDRNGARLAQVDVGAGPTGLRLDEGRNRLYVLNRFDASISTLDPQNLAHVATTRFFDPTPQKIRRGRPLLYDARKTSGLGVTACGACHVDGRTDHLAWDLGDPHGETKALDQECDDISALGQVECEDFGPLKGPMLTQTLQGIIGTEPLHWRGDRDNLEEFNAAFESLNGNDRQLTDEEMAAFKGFISTITFPPNPHRTMDNRLPADLDGADPRNGREIFFNQPIDEPDVRLLGLVPPLDDFLADKGPIFTCVRCHQMPAGTNQEITPAALLSLPMSLKVPHLRNVYARDGFRSRFTPDNLTGFGITHDGGAAGLDDFLHFPRFIFSDDDTGRQQRRDLIAFVQCFATDTHAGVGRQLTLADVDGAVPGAREWIQTALELADDEQVGLVVAGAFEGASQAFAYVGRGEFEAAGGGARVKAATLRTAGAPGGELTWMIVPLGSQERLARDWLRR